MLFLLSSLVESLFDCFTLIGFFVVGVLNFDAYYTPNPLQGMRLYLRLQLLICIPTPIFPNTHSIRRKETTLDSFWKPITASLGMGFMTLVSFVTTFISWSRWLR